MQRNLSSLLKELRGKESLRDASKRIGISHTYLDTIEKGFDKRSGKPVKPTPETLEMISKAYNYPYSELMICAGYIKEDPSQEKKISKEEKDIARRMEEIRQDLTKPDGLLFSGEPMSDEAIESLMEAMEYAVRQTQRINKKYIPKKHREKEDE